MTSSKHLYESLKRLRSEIDSLAISDARAKERLDQLVSDVEASVEPRGAAPADDTLTERLKTSILTFESSHPRLAALINDVLEKLSAMGV
jgi:hypothetical protein